MQHELIEDVRHTTGSAGKNRCPGPSWDDLVSAEKVDAPSFLRGDQYRYLGSDPISASRYTSVDFAEMEEREMWPHVWQFAAREEEMRLPGESVIYDNAGRSYILVRQADNSIRAFHNTCLHRGRRLRSNGGMLNQLKCPFHAWTWNLDGSIKKIPCKWDFEHLNEAETTLPEASVGRWQGYVFVRESDEGPSLEDYLAGIHGHFEHWRHEDCYTALWVGQVVDANWKVVMEAFLEAYHVLGTHPSLLPYTGDANTKTYILGEHTDLMITPFLTPSPHVPKNDRGEQWLLDNYLKDDALFGAADKIEILDGDTARDTMAAHYRQTFGKDSDRDFTKFSNAEMLDGIQYQVFPNFTPWGGFAPNLVYRFRPAGAPNKSLFELRMLHRKKAGEDTPACPPMTLIPPGERWGDTLGRLGEIFMQDLDNVSEIQRGLETSKTGRVNLGEYQEVRIRHFHNILDKYLRRDDWPVKQ